MSYLKTAFSASEVPVIVTLFFGALAWTVTRTIDQLSAIPALEYRLSLEEHGQQPELKTVEMRLRNITYTRQFGCFKIIIAPEKDGGFSFEPATFQMQLVSEVVPNIIEKKALHGQVWAQIDRFGPRADVRLVVDGKGDGPVRAATRGCQDLTGGENKNAVAPILLRRSLRTFLVEWELEILWGLIVLWAVVILALKPWVSSSAGNAKAGRR